MNGTLVDYDMMSAELEDVAAEFEEMFMRMDEKSPTRDIFDEIVRNHIDLQNI